MCLQKTAYCGEPQEVQLQFFAASLFWQVCALVQNYVMVEYVTLPQHPATKVEDNILASLYGDGDANIVSDGDGNGDSKGDE